jgi:hypothetical protein
MTRSLDRHLIRPDGPIVWTRPPESLGAELAAWRKANTELEALRTLVVWVRDMVLDRANESSSLAASMSMVAELFKGRFDAMTTNGVHWGTRSTLITTLLHFLELEVELELLGSGHNAALTEDQVDTLWLLAHRISDLLALHVLPLVARGPPDGAGE